LTIKGNHKKHVVAFALASMLSAQWATLAEAQDYQGDPVAVDLNNQGVRALEAQNYPLAFQKLEAAVKQDPSYKKASSNLGIAYNNYGLGLAKNKQYSEAIKYFHKAFYLDPTNLVTKKNLGIVISNLSRDPNSFQDRVDLGDEARKQARTPQDWAGPIVEYQAALMIKDDPGVREKLGDVYSFLFKYDKAINEYQNGIRIKDSAILEVKLARAYMAKNDVATAIGALGRALKLNSTDPDVLDALVAAWGEAVKANPLSPDNHVGLGQAFQYKGDFEQAKEEYLAAIRLSKGTQNPTAQALLAKLDDAKKKATVDNLINLGYEYQTAGKFKQALDQYLMALKLAPNDDTIWVNLGTVYQAMKDYTNAVKAYKQALSFKKDNADALKGIQTAQDAQKDQKIDTLGKQGNDAFTAKRYDEAIQAYTELLKIDNTDAGVHFNLGAAYQAKKDLESALREYSAAKSIDPKNQTYIDAYEETMDLKAQPLLDQALALHKAKKYSEAIVAYQQYLKIRDKNDEVWYNLGAAQYSYLDYNRAEQSYQRAFDLDPKGRVDVLYFIGTIDENNGKGPEALTDYKTYLQKAPTGTYAKEAKERIVALTKDVTATQKIKSEEDRDKETAAFDAFQKAVALQKQNQFDQALPLYQTAIKNMPDNADFVYGLGTLLQAMDRYDEAIAQYQKAKSLNAKGDNKIMDEAIQSANQDKAQPIVDDAVKKQQGGDNAGAIPLYIQALQLIPENAKLWTNLGGAYQQTDQFQKARDAYDKGYKTDAKGEIGNLYLMGQIDENFGNGASAKQLYELYIRNAGSSGAYYQLAKARLDALTKNIGDVQKLATTADIANAKIAEDSYNNGIALQKDSKFDEAIAEYQKAATANPKEFAYPFAIGTAYQAKSDFANARKSYELALTLTKNKDQIAQIKQLLDGLTEATVAPTIDEANKAYGASDFTTAVQKYEAALKITPNNADCWTFLAASYQNLGDYAKARNGYEQGYKLGGKAKADNLYFLGVLDENDGNANNAITHYTQYIQVAPSGTFRPQAEQRLKEIKANPSALQKIQTAAQQKQSAETQQAYNDAIKLQGEQKYDEALAQYGKAISASPNEPAYYYARGTCYQARNDATKNDVALALADYDKAASLSPAEKAYKEAASNLRAFQAQPLIDSAIKKQTTADAEGKYDLAGAIADYRAALKINDDPSTHLNLGTALQANNDNTGALQEYTAAINKNASLADAYYYRGLIYEDMKQLDAAKKDYNKYLQLQPAGANAAAVKDALKRVAPIAAPGKKR
jgi:tetratricopeptide (TPR) repeat protein